MSRSLAVIVLAFSIAACGATSTTSRTPISSPSASATSRAIASPTPAATVVLSPSPSGLPVIAANEPLLLYYHCWAGCGQAGGSAGIFVSGLDGTNIRRIGADAPGTHKHPDWSPDGQRVVFIEEATGKMWIAHLDGSPSTSIPTCDTPGCDYPAWSPDGSRIAFSRYEEAEGVVGPSALSIQILDLASGMVSTVVRLERPLLADVPRWSPDGKQLVIGVDRMDAEANETGAAVAVVSVTGGDLEYLTDFEAFAYYPDWNRVTGQIVYDTDVLQYKTGFDKATSAWNLFVISPDKTDIRQVTDSPKGTLLWNPRWTPDGRRITAADLGTFTGLFVDLNCLSASRCYVGGSEPFPTSIEMSRPQVRPLP